MSNILPSLHVTAPTQVVQPAGALLIALLVCKPGETALLYTCVVFVLQEKESIAKCIADLKALAKTSQATV